MLRREARTAEEDRVSIEPWVIELELARTRYRRSIVMATVYWSVGIAVAATIASML